MNHFWVHPHFFFSRFMGFWENLFGAKIPLCLELYQPYINTTAGFNILKVREILCKDKPFEEQFFFVLHVFNLFKFKKLLNLIE